MAEQQQQPGGPLSEALREKIRTLAEVYPSRRTALLPALKLAQAEVGYLPSDVIAAVADTVGLPHAAAYELASFYSMLHLHPEGQVRVVVCAQLPCAVRGAHRLLRDLCAGLGIESNETTPDGRVTVERTSECFGACHRAPMARVDDDYWESLDPSRTQQLLAYLRGGPAATAGPEVAGSARDGQGRAQA